MADIKYCRREIVEGSPCMKKITTPNALNWCADCRARLPLWPADNPCADCGREADDHDLRGHVPGEPCEFMTKEVSMTEGPAVLELFGAPVAREVR